MIREALGCPKEEEEEEEDDDDEEEEEEINPLQAIHSSFPIRLELSFDDQTEKS
jgi:hypothetical protein